MWKEYSFHYLRQNRMPALAVMTAVFVSSAFLMLVTGVFYNLWADSVERLVQEEGGWHASLTGSFSEEELGWMESFAGVEHSALSKDGSRAELTLSEPRRAYEIMPALAEKLGAGKEQIQYHEALLTQYLIHDPEAEGLPPLLLPFYLAVISVACLSLMFIIYHAFTVSGASRLHQLGILESVGATPGQIRLVRMQETAALSILPILLGILAGYGLNHGFLWVSNRIGKEIRTEDIVFHNSPLIFFASLAACLITVFLASWCSARKFAKMTPLEALRGGKEHRVQKLRHKSLLAVFGGVEGEIAQRSIQSRKKAFRTAALSLTGSFLAFSLFVNFMALSDISVGETYFERYHQVWDLMLTVEELPDADRAGVIDGLRRIDGISDCTGYERLEFQTQVTEEMLSREFQAAGGLNGLEGVQNTGEGFTIPVTLLLMDSESFAAYCQEQGTDVSERVVAVNRIWDSRNSHFRERVYLPYLNPGQLQEFTLTGNGNTELVLSVDTFSETPPDLKEEYGAADLLLVMDASCAGLYGLPGKAISCKLLAEREEELTAVENRVRQYLEERGMTYTLENRVTEEVYDIAVRKALKLLYGIICSLFACIGFANLFANLLGQTLQRRREFARYQSMGLTPGGVRKLLFMEALYLTGRPILICIPLNLAFVVFAAHASRISLAKYWTELPVAELACFAGLFLLAAVLVSFIGTRQILSTSLSESLRDDTLF